MTIVRFAVVDDHPLFVEGIIRTLEAQTGFEVVAKGATHADAVQIARESLPNILLLDCGIRGSGLATLRNIANADIAVKVLMLTEAADQEEVAAALQCGARGYLIKSVSAAELIRAVRSIHDGETYISPSLAVQLLSNNLTESRRNDRLRPLP
jgi:two-component system, NarL family, nitrate/nitrite response regulator NarL